MHTYIRAEIKLLIASVTINIF